MNLETLYPLVTEAIRRAEVLDELGAPGARHAYLDVSLLEERIASLLPVSDAEGAIARRGAVSAAIAAHEFQRAEELAVRFAAEAALDDSLRADLTKLRKEASSLVAGEDLLTAGQYPLNITVPVQAFQTLGLENTLEQIERRAVNYYLRLNGGRKRATASAMKTTTKRISKTMGARDPLPDWLTEQLRLGSR
jgi:hypothetical protein